MFHGNKGQVSSVIFHRSGHLCCHIDFWAPLFVELWKATLVWATLGCGVENINHRMACMIIVTLAGPRTISLTHLVRFHYHKCSHCFMQVVLTIVKGIIWLALTIHLPKGLSIAIKFVLELELPVRVSMRHQNWLQCMWVLLELEVLILGFEIPIHFTSLCFPAILCPFPSLWGIQSYPGFFFLIFRGTHSSLLAQPTALWWTITDWVSYRGRLAICLKLEKSSLEWIISTMSNSFFRVRVRS